jgi:hypothetical protein
MDTTLLYIVTRANGEITHMHAGTWATFRTPAQRNKALADLLALGYTNVSKSGRTDIEVK